MAHSGRNGRIAHQFVTWYLARHADQKPDPQR
jgi:predicted AAA+ superfamily ATPase